LDLVAQRRCPLELEPVCTLSWPVSALYEKALRPIRAAHDGNVCWYVSGTYRGRQTTGRVADVPAHPASAVGEASPARSMLAFEPMID
jgi:hypothetical protein